MAAREVRLDRIGLAWRTALTVFVIRQLYVLSAVNRLFPPRHRLLVFLFHRRATRLSVVYALAAAVAVVVLAELVVGLLVRPALRAWLSPRSDPSSGLFQLAASEWVIAEAPARRRRRWWSWPAGSLVRTNQRVWFFPAAWDAEPWSVRLGDPSAADLRPVAPLAGGLIDGLPDRLEIRPADGGEPEVFAIRDPQAVLAWFRPDPAAADIAAARP